MSCSIRFFVEKKLPNGSWVEVRSRLIYNKLNSCWDIPRDYKLFCKLSGVLGSLLPIKPATLSLPDDCSDTIIKKYNKDGLYAHTKTFYLLDELISYKWDKDIQFEGIVDIGQYEEFLKKGIPNEWSSVVRGEKVKIVSNSEMDSIISNSNFEEDLTMYYTKICWTETEKDSFKEFLSILDFINREIGPPETVRVVIWFVR